MGMAVARAHDRPVGRITPTGVGLSRAAGAVHWYLEYEGAQVVFMDELGHVFAFPDGTLLAAAWLSRRADCLIGRYTHTHDRRDATFAEMRAQLVLDLRERMRELKQARAA